MTRALFRTGFRQSLTKTKAYKTPRTKSQTTKKEQILWKPAPTLIEEEVTVNVISYKSIRNFCSHHRDAEPSLKAWYGVAKGSNWQNFAELKKVYPSADLVGRYTVFNIKGNKYRLIARIVYRSQTLLISAIMTYEEYDLGRWKE